MTVLEREMMEAIIRMVKTIEKMEKAIENLAAENEKPSKALQSIDARLSGI